MPQKTILRASLPQEVPGLDRFLMTGQWVEPGGGLPPALTSARNAVQVLCHRDGVPFMGQARSPVLRASTEASPGGLEDQLQLAARS